MWTVYFPFSSSEIASLLGRSKREIDIAINRHELGQSIWFPYRNSAALGYHNYVDVVTYTASEIPPKSLILDTNPLSDLLDEISALEEARPPDYQLAVSEQDYTRLSELLALEGVSEATIPNPEAIYLSNICKKWLEHYTFFEAFALARI